ncbi:hypothetical protein J2Z70_003931 [Paenibacillus silagei]|uniref:Uncharacterized protein n=1 Tax=Paenibacillus silagei TaxID=1670801 RepID=A0ABS4NWH2_9BACL|nr:hypothetical protein [Paenibacillus silagei]
MRRKTSLDCMLLMKLNENYYHIKNILMQL